MGGSHSDQEKAGSALSEMACLHSLRGTNTCAWCLSKWEMVAETWWSSYCGAVWINTVKMYLHSQHMPVGYTTNEGILLM